jgi:glycosyltransferase involved in cell wall biosynthesis
MGLLVDADSVDDLANGMTRLLRDAALRQRLALCGQERASARFTAQATIVQWERLYSEVAPANVSSARAAAV